nr:MAG TPA: hypothetical protein [Caudoviricetes sp.]
MPRGLSWRAGVCARRGATSGSDTWRGATTGARW